MTVEGSLPLDRNSIKGQEDLPPTTVFIDTETYGTDKDHYQRLLVGCYEVWRTNKKGLPHGNRHEERRGIFRSVDEFYRLLKGWGPCRIVAHNWQFDAAVLKLGAKCTRKTHNYFIDPNSGIYPMNSGGFNPFVVTLKWRDSGVTVEFIDNTNFHKTSLENLGESFGMAKLKMPELAEYMMDVEIPRQLVNFVQNNDSHCIQDSGDTKLDRFLRVIKYCKRDVEILRLGWFELFKFSDSEAGVTPGITVASMALRMYMKRWLPALGRGNKIVGNKSHPIVNEAEMDAYHGGRVEVFWRGKPEGKLFKYDANSMYPSSMLGNIPTRLKGFATADELFKSLRKYKMGDKAKTMYLADVTVEIPPDGLGWLGWDGIRSEDAGFIFPAGRFRGWFWQPMLHMAHNQKWIQEVHNVIAYDTYPIFRRYVEEVYHLRHLATVKGDKPKRLLYKYLLNSVYGKMGQGTFGEWEMLKPNTPEYRWQRRLLPLRKQCRWRDYATGFKEGEAMNHYWETDDGIYRWNDPEPGMGRRSVCSVAGYITTYARATLLSVMRELYQKGSTIYMCDTDSIITNGRLPETLIGDGLGKWKLEEISDGDKCEFMAPKHYTFNLTTKCKGIRKPVMGQNTYTQAQFSKWQTDYLSPNAERNQRLEHGAMVPNITKTVTGQNNKREVRGNGPTYPLLVDT